MKKVFLFFGIALFSIGVYASNSDLEKVHNKTDAEAIIRAEFPVYCDGVYAGTANTVCEALELCDMDC